MEIKKNVGIRIRVSTDMQVFDESPEHHEKRARLYAEAKGWSVVKIYRLNALSGKSVMQYDETKDMLADMEDGLISGLIFSKLARLARNTKELLEISEIFRQNNADLISLAEAINTSSPAGATFLYHDCSNGTVGEGRNCGTSCCLCSYTSKIGKTFRRASFLWI